MNAFYCRRTDSTRIALWATLALTAFTQTATFGQTTGQTVATGTVTQLGNSSSNSNTIQAEAEAYWTAQRLLAAKPLDLHPSIGPNGLPDATQAVPDSTPPVRGEGAAPTTAANPGAWDIKTLIPEVYLQQDGSQKESGAEPGSAIVPNGTSSFGAYFTTYRVFPDVATMTYPNLTTGKLFFSDPRTGGNFVCSASTLQRRLVVTAGHCVTHPSTNAALRYFYTNFFFVPAFRFGIAPVGTWTPRAAWVTNTWYFSDGSVPNAQDVGMLVMNDNGGRAIGNVTGWLGYFTNQLGRNHSTMLGYPCNLDACQRLEINHGQTFASGGNNTYIYGSSMRGGSSGGPWIQDYGVRTVSNPIASLGNNYLIAVTSYGPIATEPKYQGASNLDSRFISLKNAACGTASSGNCT